jgi:hypothetical protein
MITAKRINLTTDASGDVTGYSDSVAGGGFLYAVQLVDGTFDDGVDITLTAEHADLSIPLLVAADWNTDKMVYPRVLQNLNTDGTALTTHTMPLVVGRIKAVVAQGGNAKTGAVICYIVDKL